MRWTHLALATLPWGAAAAGAQAPAPPTACDTAAARAVDRRVAEYLRPLADAGEQSGVVLIARADCVQAEQAYGFADAARRIRNTVDTRFAVASITKPLTGLILERLVREGRLALADPLTRWIPDFPHGGEITIGELAAHRAGIPHRVTTPAQELAPHTAADLVRFAAGRPLLFSPGTRCAYSTAGYSVLARVLELAGGRPYAVLLDSLVLRPAGATTAVDATAGPLVPSPARSYIGAPPDLLPAPPLDLSYLVGGGSLYATARDLFRIERTLLAGRYGHASRDSTLVGGRLAWTGITNGYASFVAYDSATDITAIVTANLYTGAIQLLQRDLPRLAAGGAVATPAIPRIRPVHLSAARRAQLAGRYASEPNGTAELRFLTPSLAMLGEADLIATSDSTFASPQVWGAVVTAERDAAGRVTALRWAGPGTSVRLVRRDTTTGR